MRTPVYFAAILILLSIACKGQTPEEQKMMEDMQKKGFEAQRQHDSVMNSPQVKEIMQQTVAMEDQAKIDREKRNAEKQKNSQKPNVPKKDYEAYVDSTCNSKKFDNWSYGEADIIMGGLTRYQTDPGNSKKIGTIKADGSFSIELPSKVVTHSIIKEKQVVGLRLFWRQG